MPTLRLTQSVTGENRFRVEAALEGGPVRQTATVEFEFHFTEQDREDLRWYLEEYLQHDSDPAPIFAARIEQRIIQFGTDLFRSIFQTNEDATVLWAKLRDHLNDTRVEIITSVQEATSLPWELLRDPRTDTPLALRAESFVRTSHQSAQQPHLPEVGNGPIRILLVICRPGGSVDVPFRSVASRLIKGLTESAREAFKLDVLRPPTFDQLAKTLRAAKNKGEPYHVVHFDGHGAYENVADHRAPEAVRRALRSLVLAGGRAGSHGYLLFENPLVNENRQLVDGPTLGKLLTETEVPVLVVNACRSAHAEPLATPETKADEDPIIAVSDGGTDVHSKVRAFGSLAQEVVDAGVAGVVAMRYNVYVVTAAQFVADLYESLANGLALGEAVTLGRKQLDAKPFREIAYQPRRLQDWMVPIVYESAPIRLFTRSTTTTQLKISISANAPVPSSGTLAPEVNKRPDAGFFGRDETLLALDRAFDTQHVVLMHAYAGSGKTSTAAEFARWYNVTHGVDGPVTFTSFEQYKPLAQVLNETIGRVFDAPLEQAGIHWLTLTDEQRRDVSLQVLSQIPVLWIWDNVEPIAGFPSGTKSKWTNAEQHELADFLRAAQQTKAKFLLTSRREERGWLQELPARVRVPAMPMQERVQLARAIAEKHGQRLTDLNAWISLLQFTRGNPLTITVLMNQALRNGLRTKEQVEAFLTKLRAGEQAFEDEVSEGRDKSLGASLSYGFENAFTEAERRQLALLHFFQGFVDVDALRLMGDNGSEWYMEEVKDLTREAGISLLDRASDVGLLTPHGNGYYAIHPALPWFFKALFEQYCPAISPAGEDLRLKATRIYVEAMGSLANLYHLESQGNSNVVALLALEESNLLHARQLARSHDWWKAMISTMQGLVVLYLETGRRAEWIRLVHEVVNTFVDPVSDGPLAGREEEWSIVTDYRVDLAKHVRQLDEARRLQNLRVVWAREQAADLLTLDPAELDGEQRNRIRSLAAILHELGEIERELGAPSCVASYKEALSLAELISDQVAASKCAYNLGRTFDGVLVPFLRNLDDAERWYLRSFELRDEHDRRGRAISLGQLGAVARGRFKDARAAGASEADQLAFLNEAVRHYEEAIRQLPPTAVEDLGVAHNQLGNIYGDVGDFDGAFRHLRESIRYMEKAGNIYNAALTQFNVGLYLAKAGRFAEAHEYARASKRNYETFGDRAAKEIQDGQKLIDAIEAVLQEKTNTNK